MSSPAATVLTLVILAAVAVPLVRWQLRWALREESTRDRIIRENHERAEAARLLDPITLAQSERTYQEYAEGRARMLAAVLGEQHEEDQP